MSYTVKRLAIFPETRPCWLLVSRYRSGAVLAVRTHRCLWKICSEFTVKKVSDIPRDQAVLAAREEIPLRSSSGGAYTPVPVKNM